ncbi:MAG: hypothetical protein B6I20_03125 [Bacteroidetes bacterium 4572_117]|nr:MAG: hypothetical protein B6I20_03125 [Bacteroidetes bacterium 4572_117]
MFDSYNWNKKVILVAEDEEINYLFLEEVINRTGAAVIWAKNGQEAMDLFKSNEIDLVLMDLKMPEINGYEAMRFIKETGTGIPVIAQTAFAMSSEREEILEAGFDGYIAKPIKIPQLLSIIAGCFIDTEK